MAILRKSGIIDHSSFNRDKYLRNSDAPALFDDPLTVRDIRGGTEVISRSGNVMPRAITRDKLGEDALVLPMNLNVASADAVQVITGYDKALNDFLYAITSAGVVRLNTTDLLSPYADGAISLSGAVGGAVGETNVAIGVLDTTSYYNRNRLKVYDFALSLIKSMDAPFQYDDDMGLSTNFAFDGQYFNVYKAARASNNVLDARAEETVNTTPFSSGSSFYQTFTTGPQTTSISRVGIYSETGSATVTIEILSADGSTVIASLPGQSFGGIVGWFEYNISATVTPNTTYRLRVSATAGGPVSWSRAGGNVYPGGSSSHASTFDFAFRVYTSLSGLTSNRIERYKLDTTKDYYEYVDSLAWPSGTAPTYVMAYDKRFFYGYNLSSGIIVKYLIQNGAITPASEQAIQEDVYGLMNFNSFVYIVYSIGSSLVAVPVSL